MYFGAFLAPRRAGDDFFLGTAMRSIPISSVKEEEGFETSVVWHGIPEIANMGAGGRWMLCTHADSD
jgi:hypothetical protein